MRTCARLRLGVFRHGWKTPCEPAVWEPGCGPFSGVGVLARPLLGLHYPDCGPCLRNHRATGALAHSWPGQLFRRERAFACLLYTSDAADDTPC
eukprot:2159880-Pyramimonas_sp.AAC.1